MDPTIESIIAVSAALPGLYGIICSIRRGFNCRKVARWAVENHRQEWNSLHWLARRNPRAGIEVLITKGLISGPEIEEYRARDDYLEKSTWVGLLISAVLLFVIVSLKFVMSTFG